MKKEVKFLNRSTPEWLVLITSIMASLAGLLIYPSYAGMSFIFVGGIGVGVFIMSGLINRYEILTKKFFIIINKMSKNSDEMVARRDKIIKTLLKKLKQKKK